MIRLKIYRTLFRFLILPLIVRPRVSEKRYLEFLKSYSNSFGNQQVDVWFHAASVGELETLIPILENLSGSLRVAVTVFSESASKSLESLPAKFPGGAQIVYRGYSPWEGSWQQGFKALKPKLFITARYENWPELWVGAFLENVPLYIVGLRHRKSFDWAVRCVRLLGFGLPKIGGVFYSSKDQSQFKSVTKLENSIVACDPRLKRVFLRSQDPVMERGQGLLKLSQVIEPGAKKTIVLAQVYPQDLFLFQGSLESFKGHRLYVVPHELNQNTVEALSEFFSSKGFEVLRSSSDFSRQSQKFERGIVFLIDEFKVLFDLYRSADLVYVGGGFNRGIHNTLEPAVFGLAVAHGPKNADLFTEVSLLKSRGQLTLVQHEIDFQNWLESTLANENSSKGLRQHWINLLKDDLITFELIVKSVQTRI